MFLKGNIPGSLYCTGILLSQVVIDLWLKNMENIDFRTFFYCNFTTMVSAEVKTATVTDF